MKKRPFLLPLAALSAVCFSNSAGAVACLHERQAHETKDYVSTTGLLLQVSESEDVYGNHRSHRSHASHRSHISGR